MSHCTLEGVEGPKIVRLWKEGGKFHVSRSYTLKGE